ncbi:MAG: preprotein translocase subunit SecY, partial [Oscillospiraceae bacterium]
MFDTFRNAWKIQELRKKILYTLLILVIFRFGSAVPVPFVAAGALQSFMSQAGGFLGYLDMLTGGSFGKSTLFALSVTPYINASIIIQLLTVAIPALERLSKEGESGRRKITKITRYAGAGIAVALAIGYYFLLRGQNALMYTEGFSGIFAAVVIVLAFTAGSMLIQWLGEQ